MEIEEISKNRTGGLETVITKRYKEREKRFV